MLSSNNRFTCISSHLDMFGWDVVLLDINGNYLSNKCVFCESNNYAQQYNYFLNRNFAIAINNISL